MSGYRPSKATIAEVLAELRPNFELDDDGKRRKIGRALKRGSFERRWIAQKRIAGVEYALHATKGWRARFVGE